MSQVGTLKVALDVRPALSRPTGVGVYVGALAEALPRMDPQSRFTLFSSSLRERWPAARRLANVEVVDRRIPVRALNLAWNRLSWPPIEMLCGGAFDLVHSPHPLLIPSRRARRVVTIHDLFFFKHPGMTGAEIRRDYAPLVRDHAARADGVLCPSEHTAGDVERLLGIPRDRICVTLEGVDPAFRTAPPREEVEAVLSRLGLPRGAILYVGSNEKRKNLVTLLAAHRRLAARSGGAPPLVLVGPGDSVGNGSPRVVSLGYLGKRDIRALMSASLCLVLVSLEEGFGLPVAEAMAAGLPVVCTRGSSLGEITAGAAEMVEDPLDEEAIAAGLGRLLDDPARGQELRAAGLERSRMFDWDRTAAETLSFYRRVLGR